MSDIQTPVDPNRALSYRAAKFAVIVLSALIILALIGLVVGTVMKLAGRDRPVPGEDHGDVFVLPQGAKILGLDSQPGRLILRVTSPAGDEIDIVSTDDGHLVARIKSPAPLTPTPQ